MLTKFILHGGFASGNTDENNQAFYREILNDVSGRANILLVTFAKDDDNNRIAKTIRKVTEEFENVRGSRDIQVMVATKDDFIGQIEKSDIIYFTGGVSSRLLEILNTYPSLKSVLEGKIVAGESAGANVWCEYFYSPSTDKVSKGLGIIPIGLIPHYKKEYENKLNEVAPDLVKVGLPEYEFKIFEI